MTPARSWYVNWSSQYGRETVDEADTRTEAETLASEYRMAYGGEGRIWISRKEIK